MPLARGFAEREALGSTALGRRAGRAALQGSRARARLRRGRRQSARRRLRGRRRSARPCLLRRDLAGRGSGRPPAPARGDLALGANPGSARPAFRGRAPPRTGWRLSKSRRHDARQPSTPASADAARVRVSELLGEELADLKLSVLSGEQHLDNGSRIHACRSRDSPSPATTRTSSRVECRSSARASSSTCGRSRRRERDERFRRIASLPIPVIVVHQGAGAAARSARGMPRARRYRCSPRRRSARR